MRNLYIYTIFEKENGRPRCTGIRIGDDIKIYDLYRPRSNKLISDINKNKRIISETILKANSSGFKIVLSDFKSHIAQFDLPCDFRHYNVYDLHLPAINPRDTYEDDVVLLRQMLTSMSQLSLRPYQKLISNSAVVYHDLQLSGLTNNYVSVNPIWSQHTYSGRSKSLGFNIQGFTDEHMILPKRCSDHDILIHFDWICADIKAAAVLSGDTRLIESFEKSDPYTYMQNIINSDSDEKMSRDECKIFLLKSINSMDLDSVALSKIYTTLGRWIANSKIEINKEYGYLETILGRRFYAMSAKNNLAVLNGAMQGSVAHAMQHVIRQAWEKLQSRIVCEIHDSLVVACSNNSNEILSTISIVAPIMLYPFNGLLNSNPMFPVKVSIGKRWRQWKLFATYRNDVEYVNNNHDPQSCLLS